MKVYFAAAVTIDRAMLPVYRQIVEEIKRLGHTLVNAHVVDPDMPVGDNLSASALYKRETILIDKAEALIADVTMPSWGTAFLMEHAISTGKPALALYYKEADKPLPMMIEGHPEVYVAHYTKSNIRTVIKKNLDYFVVMSKRKGKLVVIDGTDGSGKGTQTQMLLEYLDKQEVQHKYIDFPRYYTSFHGKMVGRYLTGEFGSMESASPYLSSLFYAMDRLTARDEMVDWLEEGNLVVANRYVTSSMAFQTARVEKEKQEEFLKWIYTMEYKEHKLPKEDLVIFLYVPVAISQKLIEQKEQREYAEGKIKDIHEANVEYQKTVSNLYLELAKKYPHWEVIECVDAQGQLYPVETIHKKILATLKKRELIK
jgi:dTMP kinase